MPKWTLWIGIRYLRSKKNSRFLSFISLLSVGGVTLGVTAMIVVLSVMDGFENELQKRLMGSELHVLVTPGEGASEKYFDPKPVEDALKKGDLFGDRLVVTPVLGTEAMLKSGRRIAGVAVKGVDKGRLDRLNAQSAGGDQAGMSSIYIGQELAYEMQLVAGDAVTMVSPTETEGPLSSVPRMKRFFVKGVYRSGIPEQELHTVFTDEAGIRAFLKRAEPGVTSVEIALGKFEDAPKAAEQLREALPEGKYRIQDWRQLNAHLFASLRLERVTMFVILAFIVIVASFNIVTTLTLMVIEKKKEIGILKTMGATHREVGSIFLAEGLLIGGAGVLGGCLLGFLLCVALKRYELVELPDVYYDRTLPVTFNGSYYLGIAALALCIVWAACKYPSLRASRLPPLEGIRFG